MWIYKGESFDEVPQGIFGFIYLITNEITGQQYIGKKSCFSHTTKKVKGRKNRKHTIKESDWRNYWGSCQELKDDIKSFGEDQFTREILELCPDKRSLGYNEVKHQILNDVLYAKLENGHRAFYNKNIMNRWFVAD